MDKISHDIKDDGLVKSPQLVIARSEATRQSHDFRYLQATRLLRYARNDRIRDFLRFHQR